MKITFQGAAQTVTGSMHLIEAGGARILLDCGLMQGRRREAHEINIRFPFDPTTIDAIVLSHAHIDHSGNLPGIVKQGFRGPIWCTPATRDLCNIMLQDSAFLQEKDAEHLSKKGQEFVAPLYTIDDAHEALSLFRTVGYHHEFHVTKNISCIFRDAGHILGSATVSIVATEGGKQTTLVFSGDLGRKNRPIIRDPEYVSFADVLLIESTYGDRLHEEREEVEEQLVRTITRAVHAGGRVIVPAFSVGRTQDILYTLRGLWDEKRIPEIPVFVDSPLSTNATTVYKMHTECFDETLRQRVLHMTDPLGFDRAQYITHVEDSKRLNEYDKPCMIISASGMCEAGRILHHLAHGITDPRNTVLIVGFMAPNTLGRRLVEQQPSVRIYGDVYPIRARVENIHGMSAHADQQDLLDFVTHLDKEKLKRIFLVHGEEDRQAIFAAKLESMGYSAVHAPQRGEVVDV
jgi:metallo-beta-lactamase family protein